MLGDFTFTFPILFSAGRVIDAFGGNAMASHPQAFSTLQFLETGVNTFDPAWSDLPHMLAAYSQAIALQNQEAIKELGNAIHLNLRDQHNRFTALLAQMKAPFLFPKHFASSVVAEGDCEDYAEGLDDTVFDIFQELTPHLYLKVVDFEELDIKEQVRVWTRLHRFTSDPALLLLEANAYRKDDSPQYAALATDMGFVDPTVDKVEKGHYVAIWHDEKASTVFTHGLVVDRNEAWLKLLGGARVRIDNIRRIDIIGLHQETLLKRGEKELYRSRLMRVWMHGAWHVVRVEKLYAGNGDFFQVRTRDGEIWSYLRDMESPNLDFRNPLRTKPKAHPLIGYPHIDYEKIIIFDGKDGRPEMGMIQKIDLKERKYQVETPGWIYTLAFNHPVAVPRRSPSFDHHRVVIRDSSGDPAVYELLACDLKRGVALGRMVSSNVKGTLPIFLYFDLNKSGEAFELYGTGKKERRRFSKFFHAVWRMAMTATFRWQGNVMEGTIVNLETLPVFVQIWDREKNLRYNIPPQDIVAFCVDNQ